MKFLSEICARIERRRRNKFRNNYVRFRYENTYSM